MRGGAAQCSWAEQCSWACCCRCGRAEQCSWACVQPQMVMLLWLVARLSMVGHRCTCAVLLAAGVRRNSSWLCMIKNTNSGHSVRCGFRLKRPGRHSCVPLPACRPLLPPRCRVDHIAFYEQCRKILKPAGVLAIW